MTTRHACTARPCAQTTPPCTATLPKSPHARLHHDVTIPADKRDAAVITSDDELVEGRAHDGDQATELPDTDVAHELSVDAEHTHAVVAGVCDCDVTVAAQEAQSAGELEVQPTAVVCSDAVQHSADCTAEHDDAVCRVVVGHDDDVRARTPTHGSNELAHADGAVELELRRQHMHGHHQHIASPHALPTRHTERQTSAPLPRIVAAPRQSSRRSPAMHRTIPILQRRHK